MLLSETFLAQSHYHFKSLYYSYKIRIFFLLFFILFLWMFQDVIMIVKKSLNLTSNQNYDATLADMRKYVQSLDYGDSAVGLHVDLSKYKVWR